MDDQEGMERIKAILTKNLKPTKKVYAQRLISDLNQVQDILTIYWDGKVLNTQLYYIKDTILPQINELRLSVENNLGNLDNDIIYQNIIFEASKVLLNIENFNMIVAKFLDKGQDHMYNSSESCEEKSSLLEDSSMKEPSNLPNANSFDSNSLPLNSTEKYHDSGVFLESSKIKDKLSDELSSNKHLSLSTKSVRSSKRDRQKLNRLRKKM